MVKSEISLFFEYRRGLSIQSLAYLSMTYGKISIILCQNGEPSMGVSYALIV